MWPATSRSRVRAARNAGLVLVLGAVFSVPAPLAAQGLKLSRSLEELQTDARRDSNDAAAQYMLGLGFWSKKRYDDAEQALRLSVTIEPRFAPGWLALSVLPFARRPKLREEEAKGKVPDGWKPVLEESDRWRRRAFLIDPLVDLWILSAIDPHQPIGIRIVNGRMYVVFGNPFADLEQGHYDRAFAFFESAMHRPDGSVSRDSIPSPLLWYHGLCAAHLNAFKVAIQDFQVLLDRAVAREHGDSLLRVPLATNDYRYVLAMMYQRESDWLDAVRLYREALENDLGLYMAHLQLSRVFEARGMFDSAAVESRAAVVTNPEDPTLLLEHGIMLVEAGQLAAAEDSLRRSMQSNPRDARVPYFLGIVQQDLNRPADARESFQRFLSLAPSRFAGKIADAKRRLALLQ